MFEDPVRYDSTDDFDFDIDLDEISEEDQRRFRRTFVEKIDIGESDELYADYAFEDSTQMLQYLQQRVLGAIEEYQETNTDYVPARVLEVGCADGFLLRALREYFPQIHTVVGIDPSPVATERGRTHSTDLRTGVLSTVDVDGEFDLIIIIGNLMLHEDPLDSLKRAASMLAPGGIIVGDVKNPLASTRLAARWFAQLPSGRRPRLLQNFIDRNFENYRFGISKDTLHELARRADLDVLDLSTEPPRALKFKNSHKGSNGLAGFFWEVSDRLDRLRDERAWLTFVLKEGRG